MMQITDKKYYSLSSLVIGFLVLIFSIRNYIFSLFYRYPFGFDSFGHLYNTLRIKTLINNCFVLPLKISSLIDLFHFINIKIIRPPLMYFLSLGLNMFFRDLIKVQLYVVPVLVYAVMMIYVFKLSEIINKRTGVYSVILLSFIPGIFLNTAGINFYFAQAAMVSVVFYYFFKSNFFENRKYSIICGFCFALGMLTKRQFPTFFFGIFLVMVMLSLVKKHRQNLKNMLLFLFTAIVCGPLFFNFYQFRGYIKIKPEMCFVNDFHTYFFNIGQYCYNIISLTSVLFFYFFIFALGDACKKNNKFFLVCGASILANILFISLFSIPYGHRQFYILPFLPLMAINIIFFLFNFKKLLACILFLIICTSLLFNLPKNRNNYFQQRAEFTYNVIKELENYGITPKSKLKLGVMDDSSERLIGFELVTLLLNKGTSGIIRGNEVILNKTEFMQAESDIFLYATSDSSRSLPRLLQKNGEQNPKTEEIFLNLKDNYNLQCVINNPRDGCYVYVYKKTNI